MAGCRFVQELLDLDAGRRFAVTVVGDEPGGAYNRMQLTNVLARAATADAIELAGEQWYAAHGVTLRTGTAAVRVDRMARRVHLDDGSALPYDVLVLATGSSAVLPTVDGLVRGDGQLLPGAVAFRTLADCVAIDQLAAGAVSAAGVESASGVARPAGPVAPRVPSSVPGGPPTRRGAGTTGAVVLGAGVLGLESACGLAGRGLRVTLVQRGERLMERQLDAPASRVLTRTARSLGVRVLSGVGMRAVRGGDRVRGVVLDDGSTLDAELLVLCCGVRPRVEVARECGLDVGAGVVVDDQLRSSDPDIFSIGECAEHRGQTYGLVAPTWEHARIAARVIARPGEPASYTGSQTVTRLKAAGIELASLGEATLDEDEDHDGTGEARRADDAAVADEDGANETAARGNRARGNRASRHGAGGHGAGRDDDALDGVGDIEVVRFMDSARGVYQKLVVREGRLIGAILLGDTRNVGTITQLFDRGAALPADRAALLMVRRNAPALDNQALVAQSPTSLPGRATICQCNGVTKAGICAAWQDGARQVAEIAARTHATTGCGTCRDAVEGIVAWLAAADTEPADTEPGEPRTRPVPAGPQELGPSEYGQLPAGATA